MRVQLFPPYPQFQLSNGSLKWKPLLKSEHENNPYARPVNVGEKWEK